jgi:hypothetical protein
MARRRTPYRGPTVLPDRRTTVYRGPRVKVELKVYRGALRRLALSDDLRDACRAVVIARALPQAIRLSPRDRVNDSDGTLPYVASWRVVETTDVLVGMRRTAVRLINTAPHAAAVEWVNPDTGRGHGYHVLGRTLAYLDGQHSPSVPDVPRRAAWKAAEHPRGPGGRFVSRSPSPATGDERSAGREPGNDDAGAAIGNAIYDAVRRRRR